MPSQSTKNEGQITINMDNIMGGLCLIANPESIPDNTVAQMDNWEYGTLLNQPQVVPGISRQIDLLVNAETLFYDTVHSVWLFSSGINLYTTDFITKTLLGTLTGTYKPIYALYDNVVLIASGGQIQKVVSGTTLSTVPSSPLSHWVAHNNGRVEAFNINSDVKNYSAIGDYTGWTNTPTDISTAQFVNVGYKDASQIACSIKLSTDSIVIKTSGTAYRITSENNFAQVAAVPIAQKTYAYNQYSGMSLQNRAFFMGQEGFNSFSTVVAYGSIKVDDPSPGYMINGWLVQNIDATTKMWHLPVRKQVWVKSSNQNEVLIYHYNINSWSKRYFQYPIYDVVSKGNDIYVAYGTKIGKLDEKLDTDDGVHFQSIIATKSFVPKHKKYLIKYVNFLSYNFLAGNCILNVGSKIFPITFASTSSIANTDANIANTDTEPVIPVNFTTKKKRTRKRTSTVQVVLTVQTGRMAIRNLSIDVVEVGI